MQEQVESIRLEIDSLINSVLLPGMLEPVHGCGGHGCNSLRAAGYLNMSDQGLTDPKRHLAKFKSIG